MIQAQSKLTHSQEREKLFSNRAFLVFFFFFLHCLRFFAPDFLRFSCFSHQNLRFNNYKQSRAALRRRRRQRARHKFQRPGAQEVVPIAVASS
jgi:hypothetical protein